MQALIDNDTLAKHTKDRLRLTDDQRADAQRWLDSRCDPKCTPVTKEAARACAVTLRLSLRARGVFA